MSSATATAAASALASRAAPHRGDHRRAVIATRRNAAAAKSRATTAAAAAETEKLPANLKKIVGAFQMVPDPMQRYKQLLFFAAKLKGFDEKDRVEDNKVQGCVSQVWVVPRMGEDGLVYFTADSDSQLTKGLAALLCEGLSGSAPKEIMAVEPDFVELLGLGQSLTPSRTNGFMNMLRLMQKKTLECYMEAEKAAKDA